MTTVDDLERKRRSNRAFWSSIAVWFVTMAGIAFGLQVAAGESVRSSLAFAVCLALATVGYHVGYREGRRDYETPHPETSVPPPKQR